MNTGNSKLIDNPERRRYEWQEGEHLAFIDYIRTKDKIYLTHTEVPEALSGKGVGTRMVRAALEDVDRQQLTLIPLCPFVALYLKRNPEWKRLVLKGINIG